MKRFVGLFAIFVTLAPCGAVALAQQPKKVPADRVSIGDRSS